MPRDETVDERTLMPDGFVRLLTVGCNKVR